MAVCATNKAQFVPNDSLLSSHRHSEVFSYTKPDQRLHRLPFRGGFSLYRP